VDVWMRMLQQRLARMDVHLEGEMLQRTAEVVRRCATPIEQMTDFQLWAASVNAYSRSEVELPAWVA
jgi:hypothetical protein